MKQKRRRKREQSYGLKSWIAALTIFGALLVIGDSSPRLRQVLESVLQEIAGVEPSGSRHAGAVRVLDGDTLDVAGTRVRLFGIDAPETAQTCRRSGRDWGCGAEAAQRRRRRLRLK